MTAPRTLMVLALSTALASALAFSQDTSTPEAREYHVSVNGDDANAGTATAPMIDHLRGGAGGATGRHDHGARGRLSRAHQSAARRRVRRETHCVPGAAGEKVEIKGSEVVKGWEKVQDDMWKVVLPNAFFGDSTLTAMYPRRLVRAEGPRASHRRGLSQRRVADRGGQTG